MRYIAAYMLSVLGGNTNPKENDIKTILASVGVDCEQDRLDLVLSQLKGKNIEDVIATGTTLLAKVNSAPIVTTTLTQNTPIGLTQNEGKQDEKTEDDGTESDAEDGNLFDLFGND